jgi:hypothetical protein
MRWHILRTLLAKEALRHVADRGGIFLALMLVAAVMLLTFFGHGNSAQGGGAPTSGLTGAPVLYFVDFWEKDSPWIKALRDHKPKDFPIVFRPADRLPVDANGTIYYPQNSASVQVRLIPHLKDKLGRPHYHIMFWYNAEDAAALEPLTRWFWKETCRHFRTTPLRIEATDAPVPRPDNAFIEVRPVEAAGEEGNRPLQYTFWPVKSDTGSTPFAEWWSKETERSFAAPVEIQVTQEELTGRADMRSMIATGLVFFPLFIFCVYLLPALTCEERERGLLLAQALSPASTLEILAAKFFFYPMIGLSLAAVLAGIYRPAVLAQPFFWLAVIVTSVAYLGIGLTVASFAKTQRRASMGAMCYMLAVALFLLICQQNAIPILPNLAVEYHAPRMLHAVMANPRNLVPIDWWHLAGMTALAVGWSILAGFLFARRGWQ